MNSEYWVYYKRHEIILKYYLMMFPWPGFNTWFSPLVQFSSLTQSCPTLCDPMNCSTPGLPVHHQLLEFTQTHVHWVGDAIQPSHPLLSPSPPALNLSLHQGPFKWVSSSHQVAKVLEFQLQYQSFQMKRLSQSNNNTQLWMYLVVKVKPDAVRIILHRNLGY